MKGIVNKRHDDHSYEAVFKPLQCSPEIQSGLKGNRTNDLMCYRGNVLPTELSIPSLFVMAPFHSLVTVPINEFFLYFNAG